MFARIFGTRKAAPKQRKDFEGTTLETFRKESRDLATKCGQTKSTGDCDQAAYVGTMVYLADLVGWQNAETYKEWQTRFQREAAATREKARAAEADLRRSAANLRRGYNANSNTPNRSTRRNTRRA
jgi:hypothetical protein